MSTARILLRRIGRLPEDKGLEIARQICAGLAAAHERGILHRDLKPANIMLDGAGKVRIMDFSLAAVGTVTDVRAGTPAYMAPEQLAGEEVTVRSDIYALGLVLYEIFTGRRAFDAKNLNELLEQHQSGTLTAPSTIVRTLDPAIDTWIVRCLDPTPSHRPASAIAVSAALPGGDPLAAALAAGETPSPEMVAAAGGTDAMFSRAKGVFWTAMAIVVAVAAAVIASRYTLLTRAPLTKPAEVLADRADEIRRAFGYTDAPADQASGFYFDPDYFDWAKKNGTSAASGWPEIASGRPAVVRFWYRTSPTNLVPVNPLSNVSPTDPPLALNGMVKMTVDSTGRLLRFEAAPPQVEGPPSASQQGFEWKKAFAAAGLDVASFSEISPSRTPATFADERKAWKGTLPQTQIPITIEAAGYRGRPVLFDIVAPWVKPSREAHGSQPSGSANWILIWVLLAGAGLAAWGNVRRGRADTNGARRLGTFITIVLTLAWLVAPHIGTGFDEQQRFFARFGIALFIGFVLYIVYLGFEPFVRRLWPSMLVGWSRVLSGRLNDPMIGRDLVIGVLCGGAIQIMELMGSVLPPKLGLPHAQPRLTDLGSLTGGRSALLVVFQSLNNGMQNALLTVFEYASLRMIFEWAVRTPIGSRGWTIAGTIRMGERTSEKVFVLLCIAFTFFTSREAGDSAVARYLPAVIQAAITLVVLTVMLRMGIFATTVMFFTYVLLGRMPMSFDSSSLLIGGTWLALAIVFGMAIVGFRFATHASRAAIR
jgi:serine/threonine-protein kinase